MLTPALLFLHLFLIELGAHTNKQTDRQIERLVRHIMELIRTVMKQGISELMSTTAQHQRTGEKLFRRRITKCIKSLLALPPL